jgi:hypothetical protein
MLQDIKLFASQRIDKAVRETDQVMVFLTGGRALDDANRASWMHERIVCAADRHRRDDLGTGLDIVRLMTHLWIL